MVAWILFGVFLILKLTGVIAWSWIWVTAPLWIGLAIMLFIWAMIGLLGAAVFSAIRIRK